MTYDYCPFRSYKPTPQQSDDCTCIKNYCSFWIEDKGCAIVVIAECLIEKEKK